MHGILIGFVIAAAAFAIRRRHGWRHRHWGHHQMHHAFGYGGPGFGPHAFGPMGYGGPFPQGGRDMFGTVIDDLHLTPDQLSRAQEVFKEAKAAAKDAKKMGSDLRSKVAAALRSESFDESSTGAMLGDFDHVFETTREKMLNVFSKLYQVLDVSQRARLADWLERGRSGFAGYRSPWAPL